MGAIKSKLKSLLIYKNASYVVIAVEAVFFFTCWMTKAVHSPLPIYCYTHTPRSSTCVCPLCKYNKMLHVMLIQNQTILRKYIILYSSPQKVIYFTHLSGLQLDIIILNLSATACKLGTCNEIQAVLAALLQRKKQCEKLSNCITFIISQTV